MEPKLLSTNIMAPPKPDIVLYTSGTPNGQKASITLEELGLPYEVQNIQISKNVQKEDWYLKINPNGRIPALVDKTPSTDGKPREKRIFESGAMMLYLCERYDPEHKLSYPYDSDEYWEVVEWLVWMQSGLGPMQVSWHGPEPVARLAAVILRVVGPSESLLPLCSREDPVWHQSISD